MGILSLKNTTPDQHCPVKYLHATAHIVYNGYRNTKEVSDVFQKGDYFFAFSDGSLIFPRTISLIETRPLMADEFTKMQRNNRFTAADRLA